MRIGCCGSIESASALKAAGFDYLEVNVQAVLQGHLDDSAWAATAPDPARLALPMEAANGLIPVDLPLVGPGRHLPQVKQYMRRVTKRAERLGIERLVFGSGGARSRPEGVSEQEAFEHLVEFGRIAAHEAGEQGLVVVVEHLNRRETNTINSLADAARLVDEVDDPAFAALIDAYHFGLEGETEQAIIELGDRVQHVHVAEVAGRIEPGGHGVFGEHPDAFDFESFACALRKIGYDQRLSFEGKWSRPVEEAGPPMVAYLRSVWEGAGCCEAS